MTERAKTDPRIDFFIARWQSADGGQRANYPCIVSYRENPTIVEILAVVLSSRRWPEELP